jgi:hypothetical protein
MTPRERKDQICEFVKRVYEEYETCKDLEEAIHRANVPSPYDETIIYYKRHMYDWDARRMGYEVYMAHHLRMNGYTKYEIWQGKYGEND